MNNTSFKTKAGYLVLLALLVAAAYFPVFFHLFSLKNDALVYFLPYRYQVSSAVQESSFPWWSANIYLGTPLYSDIQSGSWNPLVILLSLFGRYNMSMLETELSIYLLAAAAGMYILAGRFSSNRNIRLIIALSYACSGFMTDSGSFIPWMNAAAVLPYLIFFFIRLLEKPGLKQTIPFTFTTFLLLTAGYPSFLVYTAYLLAGVLIALFFRYRRQWSVIRPVLFQLLLFLLFSSLLWSPVILAWTDFFPYYQRGGTIPLSFAQSNPFPPGGMLSMLIPAGVLKEQDWLQTDPGMRNISIGLFAFLLMPLAFQTILKNRLLRILALITFLSLLISLGPATPIHGWCHEYLPLFNRFRHPGTFRLFVIAGLLLISIASFERLFHAGKNDRLTRRLLWIALGLLLVITGFAFTKSGPLQGLLSPGGLSALNKAGFAELLLIQGTIQLLFTGGFIYFEKKQKTKALATIIIAQVILSAWFALPFTFISKTPAKSIDQAIAAATSKPDHPDTIALIRHADRMPGPDASPLITPAFYENQPVVNHDLISPTISTAYLHFLNDTALSQLTDGIPWAFLMPGSRLTDSSSRQVKQQKAAEAKVSLIHQTATSMYFRVNAAQPGYLHILQQYHHRWQALVNNTPTGIDRANHAFMAIKLPVGKSEVELRYQPGRLQYLLNYISLFTLALLLLLWIFIFFRLKKQDKTLVDKEAVS